MSGPARQHGAALLTVLLLLAVMLVVVITLMDDVRLALARSNNSQTQLQGREYALAAEQVLRGQLSVLGNSNAQQLAAWHQRDQWLPLDNGLARYRLHDASACFNLNSVVIGAPGQWQRSDSGMAQYHALLRGLGLPEAQASVMADTLLDWIDADAHSAPAGAEDSHYLAGDTPRRSAGQLLADPSELFSLAHHSVARVQQVLPWVCALPDNQPTPLNVNALAPEQAVLLSMLSAGAMDPQQARQWLLQRPPAGWRERAAFLAHPALASMAADAQLSAQIRLTPQLFALALTLQRDNGDTELHSLFALDPGGHPRLLARRWTLDP